MTPSNVIYVKGMQMSETEEEEELNEDIWDDKKLNDAYDKALKIASVEVAKRLAMSTNSQHGNKEEDPVPKKEKGKAKPLQSKKKHEWKVGSPCRAVYTEDGLEYEAFILRIINNKECVVRFLGYDNSEIVLLSSLKPSTGSVERTRQIEQALKEKAEDGNGSQSSNLEGLEYSDWAPSPLSGDQSSQKKKSKKKKKNNSRNVNNIEIPDMPFPMPNASIMRNLGTMEMPFAPPPPLNFANSKTDSEEQAISSMLLSWYMSGYYTGLYQGMKRANSKGRRN